LTAASIPLPVSAFGFPALYGLMTVAIAVAAGLIASTMFRKAAH